MLNKLKEMRETGSEEGFTLIELMIVVVIIGILAAIAIPIFANQQKSAIVAGVKSDVKNTNTNIATALVKAPTSGNVAPLVGATEGSAVTKTASAGTQVVVSDSATTIEISGGWNDYVIIGRNTAVATTGPTAAEVTAATTTSTGSSITSARFGVVYGVATGKNVTIGG